MPSEVFCFIPGEDSSFPVKIDETESVGTLKEEIKAAKHPELEHVAANKLTLYKVEIEDELDYSFTEQGLVSHLNQLYQDRNQNDGLRARRKLSEVFPPGKSYYILVQVPPSESIYCGAVILMASLRSADGGSKRSRRTQAKTIRRIRRDPTDGYQTRTRL